MSNAPVSPEADQLAAFHPAEITRPDVNLGRAAGRIFASPYSRDLYEPKVYEWQVRQGEVTAEASLAITPLKGKKRPTTTTLKVFLALVQLWELSGKPTDGRVNFSARQLAHILGWKWSGENCARRIQEQLTILKGTQIDWLRAFTTSETLERKVSEMNILAHRTYLERRELTAKEKFSSHQSAIFDPYIVRNMLADHTKPFNFAVFMTIKDETAATLYALIDSYLSKKCHWARRAQPLLRDELMLEGKRYDERYARKERLNRFVRDLDGIELSSGKLRLYIAPTSDNMDWKLVAVKIPAPVPKAHIPDTPANPKEAIPHIVDAIAVSLYETFRIRITPQTRRTFSLLAMWYSRDLVFQALGIVKADMRDTIKSGPVKAFMYQMHRRAHAQGLPWIKPCGPDCRYHVKSDELLS